MLTRKSPADLDKKEWIWKCAAHALLLQVFLKGKFTQSALSTFSEREHKDKISAIEPKGEKSWG